MASRRLRFKLRACSRCSLERLLVDIEDTKDFTEGDRSFREVRDLGEFSRSLIANLAGAATTPRAPGPTVIALDVVVVSVIVGVRKSGVNPVGVCAMAATEGRGLRSVRPHVC